MRFDLLTVFPEMFISPFGTSIIRQALLKKQIEIFLHDLRVFSEDPHGKVDDTPYGGGAGMVLTPQPIFSAIKKIRGHAKTPVIYLTAQGERFTQKKAVSLAKQKQLILLCGHYEGIDQRVRDNLIDEEISIGDYVLTGGELPAMVLVDAITRLLPSVLHNKNSAEEESFSEKFNGKKEYPHYTKPENFLGFKVPKVLLSGNHEEIQKWREKNLQ